jgi:hypothetical protein
MQSSACSPSHRMWIDGADQEGCDHKVPATGREKTSLPGR